MTAAGVLRAIDRDRYDVLPVGITRDGRWVLAPDDPDRWSFGGEELPEVESLAGDVVLPLGAPSPAARVVEDGVLRDLGAIDVVFPCCTGRSGRTGHCRASSRWRTSTTSARACSPRRSAWTSTSPSS
ncbi:hypothetical protein GCM10025865_23930 [Paraoerskovia sediminicola]|uniref:D-alanine--D-alanine ligase N-terminal domain-containing protein n=1 Tax=Paraoerskovia sediminicola TaxID=1138587 RepID=A0ABN6XE03_9CELL|nr:hypothetical protein GCM10025865_23930 [Paraoerskovia sediminicola]